MNRRRYAWSEIKDLSESLMTGRRYAWSEIKDLSEFYVITYLNKCHVFDE